MTQSVLSLFPHASIMWVSCSLLPHPPLGKFLCRINMCWSQHFQQYIFFLMFWRIAQKKTCKKKKSKECHKNNLEKKKTKKLPPGVVTNSRLFAFWIFCLVSWAFSGLGCTHSRIIFPLTIPLPLKKLPKTCRLNFPFPTRFFFTQNFLLLGSSSNINFDGENFYCALHQMTR